MKKEKSRTRAEELVIKFKGDRLKLIKELKKLIREGQRNGDILLIGAACYQMSIAYYDDSDWDNMFFNAIKAVTYLDKTEEYDLMAKAHIALSYVYEEQENSLMSFEECDKAYQLLKKHRINNDLKIIALNNLSTCYQMMKDTKSAIRMADECIKQIEKYTPEDLENLAMVIINKANFHNEAGDINKAIEILHSIGSWIDEVEYKPLVCDYYLRLASYVYELGDNNRGRELTKKALPIVPNNSFPAPLYDDLREIGHFAIQYNEKDIADKIYEFMLLFVEKAKGTVEQTMAYRFITDYHRGFGNYEKASEYYQILDEIYDNRIKDQKSSQCRAYTKMKLADSQLNQLNKKLKEQHYLSSREPLTGLLNRSSLIDVASNFISIANKRKQKVGAIFIDIDYFKEVNDSYGHARGDEIIKQVADFCKKEENQNVRFARYGGDEFFGITYGLKDDEVIEIARNISRRIKNANIPNEKSPHNGLLTLSIGVMNVIVESNSNTIIDIISSSDKAMYHAKNAGKNGVYLINRPNDNRQGDISFQRIEF